MFFLNKHTVQFAKGDGPSGKGRGEWEPSKSKPKNEPIYVPPPPSEKLTFEKWVTKFSTATFYTEGAIDKLKEIFHDDDLTKNIFKDTGLISLFKEGARGTFFQTVLNVFDSELIQLKQNFSHIPEEKLNKVAETIFGIQEKLQSEIKKNLLLTYFGMQYVKIALYQEWIFWRKMEDALPKRRQQAFFSTGPELRAHNTPLERPTWNRPEKKTENNKEQQSKPSNGDEGHDGPRGKMAGSWGDGFAKTNSNQSSNRKPSSEPPEKLTVEQWQSQFPNPSDISQQGFARLNEIIVNTKILQLIFPASIIVGMLAPIKEIFISLFFSIKDQDLIEFAKTIKGIEGLANNLLLNLSQEMELAIIEKMNNLTIEERKANYQTQLYQEIVFWRQMNDLVRFSNP